MFVSGCEDKSSEKLGDSADALLTTHIDMRIDLSTRHGPCWICYASVVSTWRLNIIDVKITCHHAAHHTDSKNKQKLTDKN